MRRVVFLPLVFFSLMAGQEATVQKDFRITEAHYRLGKYEIVIKQQRRLKELSNQKEFDTHVGPVWCSASLEIIENGKITDGVEYKDIQPLGGHYGIFAPIEQPSKKHLIFTEFGGYDSRTIIITDEGKVINFGGGTFNIFLRRYLVSPRSLADYPWYFSIFDLETNKLVLRAAPADLIKDILPDLPKGKHYDIKYYTDRTDFFAGIVIYDYPSPEAERTNYFYRIDLETGKTTDAVFDDKKHTEFVIDDSNLDLSSECECRKKVDKLS
jgi:hypothetical protein